MNNAGVVRRCITAAALLFMCFAPADAQTLTAGAVSGTVRNVRGNVLSDVLITVTARGGAAVSVMTDIEGEFTVDNLAPGDYVVRAERIGFVPREYLGLSVLPNRFAAMKVVLQPTQDPAPAVQSERFVGSAAAAEPDQSQWVSRTLMRGLPFMRDELDETALLSTRSDGALAFEGLSPAHTSFAIDGYSFRSAALPQWYDSPAPATAFPMAALDGVSITSPQNDVEWGGAAGATLAGYSRGASSTKAVDLSGATGLEGTSFTHLKGAVAMDGSLSDNARFGITIAGRQGSLPISADWRPSAMATDLVIHVRDREGVDLGERLVRGTVEDNALSAVGRLGWRVGERHVVESTLAAGVLPEGSMSSAGPLGPRLEKGTDALAGATVRSVISDRLSNSLRLSIGRSSRETLGGGTTPTLIVGNNLAFGTAAPASATESSLQVTNAVEFTSGRNTVKAGVELLWTSYEHSNNPGAAGEFLFGNVAQLDLGTGGFERTTGGESEVSFSSPRIGVFAQNRWTSPIGADVVVGFRAEQVSIGAGDVAADQTFLTLTGIASNRTPEASWQISPRVAARWDVRNEHTWVLHASAGVFHDRLDPAAVTTWMADNGTATVHQLVGTVGSPFDPDPAGARTARRVTLLDGEMRGPQSARISAGITRAVGTRGVIDISGAYRDTRYLPTRTDLNLIPAQVGADIFGRPVYGQLTQLGELVLPQPGTNRRFSTYDEVAALRTDARAKYWGVTVGGQMEAASMLSVLAQYTFSKATDDWFGTRTGGWMTPGPGALPGTEDWTEGTSDFDAPHRAVIALAFQAPLGIGVTGIYRFESGRPFTPGFQNGVDINGDGYAGNDPAFVDASIPGAAALVSEWSCLKPGSFAERNSCRAADTHTLDARARVVIRRGPGIGASIVADALNVMDARIDLPDAALFVVAPAGTLVQAGGTVTVPLVANPRFGRGRAAAASRRVFRLGISLEW